MEHFEQMEERLSRGEYQMPQAHVLMQNEYMNILGAIRALRQQLQHSPAMTEIHASTFKNHIYTLASLLQTNLNMVRDHL